MRIPKGPILAVLAALVATGVLGTPESTAAQPWPPAPESCVACKLEQGSPPECVPTSYGYRWCKVTVASGCETDQPPFPEYGMPTCIARLTRMAALAGVASGVGTDSGWWRRDASDNGSAACDIATVKRHYSPARIAEIRAGLQRVTV